MQRTFSVSDLYEKAKLAYGLEGDLRECMGKTEIVVKQYVLDDRILAALATVGITRTERPKGIYTLSDTNEYPQELSGYAPSNYWNFKPKEGEEGYDLSIDVCVTFENAPKAGGLRLAGTCHGAFFSAVDVIPVRRMFLTLVGSDPEAPQILRDLYGGGGTYLMPWDKIDLAGLMTLHDLFNDFALDDERKAELKQKGVFDPKPSPLMVPREHQEHFMSGWSGQFDAFHKGLAEARTM